MKFFSNFVAVFFLVASILFIFLIKRYYFVKQDSVSSICEDCNVILISIDTLRADHLGSYGYSRDTSPYIDQLAQKSILFENAIAQSPWTLSSHMSILTGLYPIHHGVLTKFDILSDSIITLADVLYGNAYMTAAFTDGGFVRKSYNYHHFEVFNDEGWIDCHANKPTRSFQNMYQWLEKHHQQKFFLFWQTYQVHSPYTPPEEYDMFSDRDYAGIVNILPDLEEPACEGHPSHICTCKHAEYFEQIMNQLTETDIDYVRSKYDGNILFVDQQISQLMDLLKEKGIYDKTVIVITSDHGESFVDRDFRKKIGHFVMYDEVLRVPLIIKVPGSEKGQRIKSMVETIDIMPTVLSLLGLEIPKDLDGVNLFDIVDGTCRKDWVFSEHVFSKKFIPVKEIESEYYAVYYKQFKLIHYKTEGMYEFYNLDKDPHEIKNIYSAHRELEKKMKDALQTRQARINDEAAEDEPLSIEPSELEKIRSLGYL